MSLRHFIFGLTATFGIAWLAVVIVPYFKMRNLPPIVMTEEVDGAAGVFQPKRAGRIANGAEVYAANGCYLCHTQVVRPTYAGNDLFRQDWGGLRADPERGDTRRETNPWDFQSETFAQIGVMRLGPDLSNLGRRVEAIYAAEGDPEAWLYAYLYDPRHLPERRNSVCPSMRFLFVEREIKGVRSAEALPFGDTETTEILPGPEARALVSYLMSLKKDGPVPANLNFAPRKVGGDS
jgi:cytochrome c oxidase cbb3-type subunit II